jgi:hypothetical protein
MPRPVKVVALNVPLILAASPVSSTFKVSFPPPTMISYP